MNKRPYHNRDEIAPLVYALLSIHAVGRDNAKKARFFMQELQKLGFNINIHTMRQILRDHPRAGILDGNVNGGYYLITTRDEARQTANALEERARKLNDRAATLRKLFDITQ